MMNMLAIFACCLYMLSMVPDSSAVCQRRVCYFWNNNAKDKPYLSPEDIDPYLCTHLIYTWANLKNGRLVPFDAGEEDAYEKFNSLKKKNPNLKTLLSVGGWDVSSAPFTSMVATESTRKGFIEHAIKFLRSHKFDGLDFVWMYPTERGSPADDKHRFTMLVQETRAAFEEEAAISGKSRLLLTCVVTKIKNYEVPALIKGLDMLNVHTIHLHGMWAEHTSHNSPLYCHGGVRNSYNRRCVDSILKSFVKLGAPKDKINVFLTTSGKSFTLRDKSKNEVGALHQDVGSGAAGKYTGVPSERTHYGVCEMIAEGATVRRIDYQRVPYLVKGDQWVGYEDQESIREKVEYINREGYGGYAVYTLDRDDFRGSFCKQGPFPLANAAKDLCSTPDTVVESKPVTQVAPGSTPEPSLLDRFVSTADYECESHQPGFFPNPVDCSSFFLCVDGNPFKIKCREGLEFNAAESKCDDPSKAKCVVNKQ